MHACPCIHVCRRPPRFMCGGAAAGGRAVISLHRERRSDEQQEGPFEACPPWPIKATLWNVPTSDASVQDIKSFLFLSVFHCSLVFSLLVLTCGVPGVAGNLLCQKEEWGQHSAKCEDHTCNWTGRVSANETRSGTFCPPFVFSNCELIGLCHSQKNQTLCVYQLAFKR